MRRRRYAAASPTFCRESAYEAHSRIVGRRSFPGPRRVSNRAPQLVIHWDANQINITGTELVECLDKGTPRILVGEASGRRPDKMQSSANGMPYMMAAGEERL